MGPKKLIHEIHRRSLWQVLSIYLVGAWIGYEVIQSLTEGLGLPSWFPPLAIVLFIIGLPIVLATAFVQEGVSRPPADGGPEDGEATTGTSDERPDRDERSGSVQGVLTWRNAIAGGVLVFALWGVIAAAWVLFTDRPDPRAAAAGGAADTTGPMRLVVLPFDNLGPPEDEYFADGMTEEITARLAAVEELGIIGRTSALQYKRTDKTIEQIGRELEVDYLLEGTVRWEHQEEGPSRVRVTPQLIRAADATHVWAEVYEEAISSVFEVQTDIAREVVRALDIALVEPEREALESAPTDDVEAYELYLRGLEYGNRSSSGPDIRRAIELYRKAISLDPGFAAAYARLSVAHSSLYWYGDDVSQERLRAARRAADRAIEVDPELPAARVAQALYYYHGLLDYDRALEQLDRARERQPNNSELIVVTGWIQRRQGRWESALANIRRRAELDPQSATAAFSLGETHLLMRQYPQAEEQFDRAIVLSPEWEDPYLAKAWLQLSWTGDREAAREAILDALRNVEPVRLTLVGDFWLWWLVRILGDETIRASMLELSLPGPAADSASYFLTKATVYGQAGQGDRARAYYDSARAHLERRISERGDAGAGRHRAHDHSELGIALAGLGRNDAAIAHARKAVEEMPLSLDAFSGAVLTANLALVQVMTGDHDGAIENLEHLLYIPGRLSPAFLEADPAWRPLRDDPRFERLVGH